jgi:His/Glu/Gln/Arg/opine family amino acid ABC transporter permease subunit
MNFDTDVVVFGLPNLLRGLVNTVFFCTVSIALGLVLATLVALMRLSRRAILRYPALWFVEVIRNTPFLVQAFIVFFALPPLGVQLAATTAGILVLTLYAGAYVAEAIRGAILSVPKGQMEAARGLGMPYLRAMRRIVFPADVRLSAAVAHQPDDRRDQGFRGAVGDHGARNVDGGSGCARRVVQSGRDLRDGRPALLGIG